MFRLPDTIIPDGDGFARFDLGSYIDIIDRAEHDQNNNDGCTDLVASRTNPSGWTVGKRTPMSEWLNGHRLGHLRRMVNEPSSDITSAIESYRRDLAASLPIPQSTRRRRFHNLPNGSDLCPYGVARRDPMSWSAVRRTPTPARIVHIGVNLGIPWSEPLSYPLWRGAAVAALVDLYSAAGLSVAVSGVKCLTHYTKRQSAMSQWIGRMVIKQASEPLDIGAVATVCADGGFMRCAMVTAVARECPYVIRKGCGQPHTLPKRDRAAFDLVIDRDLSTRDAVLQFITNAAQELHQ